MTDAEGIPLPEVQAAVDAQEDVRRANRKVVRNLSIIGAIVGASLLGGGFWVGHEVALVRQTQISNSTIAHCQAGDFNIIGSDVAHLLAGDKNPRDYPLPKPCN